MPSTIMRPVYGAGDALAPARLLLDQRVTSGSRFLLAARQCEIAELEQLARTGDLVGAISRCVHALQRERGLSSIFLGSHGERCAGQRAGHAAECAEAERQVRLQFEALDTDAARMRNGARLFSRIAAVLHALDGLPALRARITACEIGAPEATDAFSSVIAGLLAVVFEAADAATDPGITRALVAMFNLMQGKEFAGQERALGGRVFAAGCMDESARQQWLSLVDSQQSCLQAFRDFAGSALQRADDEARDPVVAAEIERLRRSACTAPAGELARNASEAWYAWCTRRLDALKALEDELGAHLRRLCAERIAQARAELREERAVLEQLVPPATAGGYGPQVGRAILAMVQEQSRRLQAMGDELEAVRAALGERKVVERAKGLLMAHRQMSEDEAYKALRQMAMHQKRRLVDVANAVLSLADVLPGGPPAH